MTPRDADSVVSEDGITIVFDAVGNGTCALVFVHGWSCDRTYWRHQVDAFADAYRVVTVDLPGHGELGDGRSSWTMPSFGGDLVAVVDHLALRDVVLIGHSMGGDIVVEAALRLGERVAGLVWVDTYHRLTVPETEDEIQAFLEPFRRDFVHATRSLVRRMFPPTSAPDLVEAIAKDMSSAPPRVAFDALEHSFRNEGPVMAGLQRLASPIVAINPDYRPTDVDSLRHFGVETVIASGVGHFLMLEDADQFNRLLEDVLNTRIPKSRRAEN